MCYPTDANFLLPMPLNQKLFTCPDDDSANHFLPLNRLLGMLLPQPYTISDLYQLNLTINHLHSRFTRSHFPFCRCIKLTYTVHSHTCLDQTSRSSITHGLLSLGAQHQIANQFTFLIALVSHLRRSRNCCTVMLFNT